jgi:hypothetical protein
VAYPLAGTPYPAGSANPSPAYSGTFIPEIWSGKLIEKFYATTVLAAIANTDYEGEIKNQGDKVNIRTRPTVTIRDYTAGQTLLVERPSSNIVNLAIDKGKYFNTILDDVHDIQSRHEPHVDVVRRRLRADEDHHRHGGPHCASRHCRASNRGTTAGVKSASINLGVTGTPVTLVARNPTAGQVEVVDMLVRLGQVLDEQNIPETGRWVVVPAWVAARIKMSELRDASLTGDAQSILRNGRLGMVDRFTIYSSNLLPSGVAAGLAAGEWAIYAGHAHALTFATQMTKMETLRSESTFGTLLRGLQIYGYGVLDSTAIAQAIVVP